MITERKASHVYQKVDGQKPIHAKVDAPIKVQYISENRRPETFALRIDKATSSRCISESRRPETKNYDSFLNLKVLNISESRRTET